MKSKLFRMLALLVLVVGVAACRTAAVYNVMEAPLNAPASATINDVTKAIKLAGSGLGWQMKEVAPGKMVGTLVLRSHRAVVDINYDTAKFSIGYKDSANLKYDGTMIHSNYNGWIQNLEQAIIAQAMSL